MSDMHRILLLGEGNFSFTLSLLKRLKSLGERYKVLATSFDSREQVLTKYPDTVSSMKEMLKDSNVVVQHDVDATCLDKSNISIEEKYSDIIFNFPHLGKEDCNAHSSMLAHIMNSCIPYLEDSGTLTISLAEEQGNRWKIHAMAERSGLTVVSELEFRAHEWPGYMLMRHHVGRSFGGRVQRCLHYGLRIRSSCSERKSVLQYLSEHTVSSELVNGCDTVVTTDSVSAVTKVIKNTNNKEKDGKLKKRKLDLAVEGHYHRVSLNATSDALLVNSSGGSSSSSSVNRFDAVTGEGWQCGFCCKVLSTEQGVKTHVYSHINTAASTSAIDNTANDSIVTSKLQCPHCNKIAPNKDALDQHIGAKHGLNRDIKPAWAQAVKNNSENDGDDNTFHCVICGLQFNSSDSLQAHLDHGFVPQSLELSYNCSGCGKQFSDERGKLQHENFCLIKTGLKGEQTA